jgi:hypothetical protein
MIMFRSWAVACAAIGVSVLGASTAEAGVPNYQLVGSFTAPGGAFDILPDGRLISVAGDTVVVQDTLNASSYTPIGSITPGAIAGFGASFVSVNPSGTRLAIGDNDANSPNPQDVLLVDIGALSPSMPTSPTLVASPNNAGAWADDETLFVSGAAGGPTVLTRIDALSASGTTVVDQINGASAGVAVRDGRVFTGNGFGSGSGFDATGAIGSFDLVALLTASSAVAFDSGTLVANALSASTIDFDAQGNLIVGGSDAFGSGEGGFVSVIDADALPGATAADGIQLFPASGEFGFPGARFNPVTNEILVTDFGSDLVLRYIVPAPGGLALFAVGAMTWRRRRA